MIGYDFNKRFQLKLLALLVRKPEKVLSFIRAQHFTHPIHTDIARIATDAYESHGTSSFRFERDSLRALLYKKVSPKRRRELWGIYKEVTREIFKLALPDEQLLIAQAAEFARQQAYREALVDAERDLSSGRFESVHRRFETLHERFAHGNESLGHWDWENYLVNREDHEPVSWLVEGLIPARAITVFTGKRGDFKTYLALCIAKAVAAGRDFDERKTEETRVLYLNRDNPQSIFMTRLIDHLGLGPEDENFAHWSLWHPNGEPPRLGLSNPVLRDIAKRYQPFLIFDSLRRFHTSEENSATEMSAIFEECRRLVTIGATVLILHNLGKEEKRGPRGSSDIGDAADMMYEISVKREETRTDKKLVSLIRKKDRVEGKEESKIILQPQLIFNGWKKKIFRFREVKQEIRNDADESQEAIIRLIEARPGISQKEIIKTTELPKYKVHKILKEGIERYWTTKRGDRKTIRYFAKVA